MSWRSDGPLDARTLRTACVIAAIVIGLLAQPSSVAAHSILLRSDPPDGARLASAPGAIRLTFSEEILPALSSFELVGGAGEALSFRSTNLDPRDPSTVVLEPASLPSGVFRVRWRAVSLQDLHGSTGTIVFGIGLAPPPAEPALAAPVPLSEIAARWLELAGLAIAIGTLVVAGTIVPRGRRQGRRVVVGQARASALRRLVRLAGFGAALGALGCAARIAGVAVDVAGAGHGPDLAATVGTGSGVLLAGQLSCLGAAAALLLRPLSAARLREARPAAGITFGRLLVSLGLIAGAVALHAATTHLAGRAQALGLTIATLHLVAAGVWAGGLVALGAVALPRLRSASRADYLVALALLRRFGVPAVLAAGGLAVSGLAAAGILAATPDAVIVSEYGHLLLLKSMVLAVIALLGLWNALTVHAFHRRLRHGLNLVGRVRLEAGAAVGAVGLAAALAVTPPALDARYGPDPAPGPGGPQGAQVVGDLLITIDLTPGTAGPNIVAVGAFDTRRPAPAPIDRVRVSVSGPDGVMTEDAERVGPGRYELVTEAIDGAGSWRLEVAVERAGLPDARLDAAWQVERSATQPTIISRAPLAGLLAPFVLAGLAMWVLLVAFVVTGRDAVSAAVRGLRRTGSAARPASAHLRARAR